MEEFFVFLLGLGFGSFLNAVVFRLEKKEGFVKGRSRCMHCGHALFWYELIPVLSFVIQKGKCRKCKKRISWQYPLVELACAFLFLAAFFVVFEFNFYFFYLLVVFWFLLFIFVFDWKHYIIPNGSVYFLIAISFFYNLIFNIQNIISVILASFLSFGFFAFLYLVSSGKWIGMGDVKYGVFMGLFLGWPDVLVALFFSYIIGAVVGIFLIYKNKKSLKSEISFGPFLVLGTLFAYFFASEVISFYLL